LVLRCLLAAGLLCIVPAAPGAGTQLAISAVVLRYASVSVHGQPAALVLSPADVARGYVDVPQGASLEVRSNSPEGFVLEFHNRLAGEQVREIEVSGAAGGRIVLPGAAQGTSTRRLVVGYRILLQPSARPGTYPWPVQVVASPL